MQNTLQRNCIHAACVRMNIATKHIFWYLNLQPTVFHLHWLGWTSTRSPMTENTQLVGVCYQGLPYILLRHVCLSLSGPITVLQRKTNKTHMHTHLKTLGSMCAHPFPDLSLKKQVTGKLMGASCRVCVKSSPLVVISVKCRWLSWGTQHSVCASFSRQ